MDFSDRGKMSDLPSTVGGKSLKFPRSEKSTPKKSGLKLPNIVTVTLLKIFFLEYSQLFERYFLRHSLGATLRGTLPGTLRGTLPGTLRGTLPGTLRGILPGTLRGTFWGTLPGTLPGTYDGS